MRGQQERTGPLFSYISTEDRIPASHPLRQWRLILPAPHPVGLPRASPV